jgi:hypothetical protein
MNATITKRPKKKKPALIDAETGAAIVPVPPSAADSALAASSSLALTDLKIEMRMPGVNAAGVLGFLNLAVPAYLRTRERAVKEAAVIGLALIMIRDHAARGTLEKCKTHLMGGRSVRTLNRCIALAQKFVKHAGLLDDKSHKLKADAEVSGLVVQTQLDFDAGTHPMIKAINEWAGDHTMTELMENDLLGADDEVTLPPNAGGGGGAGRNRLGKAEQQRKDFQDAFNGFKKAWTGGREPLLNKELLAVEVWLTKALDEVQRENAQRAKAGRGRK